MSGIATNAAEAPAVDKPDGAVVAAVWRLAMCHLLKTRAETDLKAGMARLIRQRRCSPVRLRLQERTFAYVYPDQPAGLISVQELLGKRRSPGHDSRAGTIVHS